MDYFNEKERVQQKKFASYRDKCLKYIIVFFVKNNLSKNSASFIGVCFLFLACLLNPFEYYWIIALCLFFYLFFDAIDGGIARYTKTANENGSVIDIICDQLGVVFLTASAVYFYQVDSIASLLYANSYIAFIILVVYLNQRNINTFPFLRVKYIFYILYLISPFIGVFFIEFFICFFAVYYIVMFIIFMKYLI
ncbi:MAG: CDP-alcohol phosphatidyltransferase family protein [Pasteurellaceae bacterium]|nr:CDP-alcohol phosphatidyltransferase family protein [Pasteurellaceae bacterium]